MRRKLKETSTRAIFIIIINNIIPIITIIIPIITISIIIKTGWYNYGMICKTEFHIMIKMESYTSCRRQSVYFNTKDCATGREQSFGRACYIRGGSLGAQGPGRRCGCCTSR